jgi:cell division protein FtsQ
VRLDVVLEEHVPIARWGATALVNTHGEVFRAAYDGELPVFVGPEGAAREIAIQYRYFQRSLAAMGETPVQVQVSARRAWQVKLQSGLTLELGRENIEARFARFVALHARTIGRLERRIDYVDLRYANGFAVRVPELRNEKAEPKRGRRTG